MVLCFILRTVKKFVQVFQTLCFFLVLNIMIFFSWQSVFIPPGETDPAHSSKLWYKTMGSLKAGGASVIQPTCKNRTDGLPFQTVCITFRDIISLCAAITVYGRNNQEATPLENSLTYVSTTESAICTSQNQPKSTLTCFSSCGKTNYFNLCAFLLEPREKRCYLRNYIMPKNMLVSIGTLRRHTLL